MTLSLLEQLPHGLAGGLPRRPAPHPLTDLAFLDGVIVPHQLGQGVQESSESYLPHARGGELASVAGDRNAVRWFNNWFRGS